MSNIYNLPIPTYEPNIYYIGVDEVARGCLAGPVVACAVCLDIMKISSISMQTIPKIADSKKLNHKQRVDADNWIKQHTQSYAIAEANTNEIDQFNIRNATFLAMSRALKECLAGLSIDPSVPNTKVYVTIDGNAFKLPPEFECELNKPYIEYKTQIKGDATNLNVACASIMAKKYRDNKLDELVNQHPELACYDWANNRAYGTKKHFELIRKHGISNYHRKSFLKNIILSTT